MEIAVLAIFVIGYIMIAAEHPLRIDKAASALITGVLCWTLYVVSSHEVPHHLSDYFEHYNSFLKTTGESPLSLHEFFDHRLLYHVQEIAGILLFLMGAMTIVEIVDAHEGFRVITDRINARSKVKLMWIIALISFFLSSVLDNLTTSIVMISLCRKLIADQKTRWFFGGIIVIAANAGGAWSPIGDVTTTMLWIGKQITSMSIVKEIFLASLMNLLLPLIVLSFVLKGNVERPSSESRGKNDVSQRDRMITLFLGVGGLLFVPVFKTFTHLPPFMGIMFSLGILWIATELMHGKKLDEDKSRFSALYALRKIDMPSVLFFLGILLAVSALQEIGLLITAATWLSESLNNVYAINIAIGLLSAVIDNVPLVAASMGMYEIAPNGVTDPWLMNFVQDGHFWHFLAYAAGTGGSVLIIGSAAGVAVMGLEKIDFLWYLKKISLWALLGYFGGAIVYIAEMALFK
ncbi:MAG: sodium:proton antiporter NhaD [Crocinitomicaceae bacterium]|nr:sodium:proton antiporter NhaD [Crocinitomicaceae bacterium]